MRSASGGRSFRSRNGRIWWRSDSRPSGWSQRRVNSGTDESREIGWFYLEYQRRGGQVHANGKLQVKPWGTREFAAIDPNGVCVTFQE